MSNFYSLKFDVKIIKLVNSIEQGLDEKLFIRYFIPTLGNRRIRVDTKEIHSMKDVLWNECASFECCLNSDQIQRLELSHITFELRCRKSRRIFGGIMTRSSLLGKGEIPLKGVIISKATDVDKWVNFGAKSGKLDGLKLPDLHVEIKVQITRDEDLNRKRNKCDPSKECDWIASLIDYYHVETIVD